MLYLLHTVTFRDEIVSTVGVATQTRHVDRKHTPGTSTQEVGTIGNQRLGNGLVAVTGGNMQSSVALLVSHINSST